MSPVEFDKAILTGMIAGILHWDGAKFGLLVSLVEKDEHFTGEIAVVARVAQDRAFFLTISEIVDDSLLGDVEDQAPAR